MPRWLRRGLAWLGLGALACLLLAALLVLVLRFVNPPANIYQLSEARRLGGITRAWVDLDTLPAHVALSAAAAEDANFCVHHGFDLDAIRAALAGGGRRGASTISQQTAKNVFLWPARSWLRKGMEAGFTLLIEGIWPKHRIMEVYLNVAEFDTGVFGIEAAARHHFGIGAAELSRTQAARLMAVLPDPKGRSAVRPAARELSRAAQIAAGARTLDADGRGACLAR
ncbi:monofunctional biosynthetic peptidoglycan transglycosylase [Oceanibium sediminis]|uniref:monofunctional biosynthetic peptidoglycan transglycosylase n=1 Tax=Oceanibium sediminis TaxID=2026339 RepID=UPI001E4ACE37|nr:monofunctional biosynthetic peptidoglycan transglycosylase [Oceanibium sediminis]